MQQSRQSPGDGKGYETFICWPFTLTFLVCPRAAAVCAAEIVSRRSGLVMLVGMAALLESRHSTTPPGISPPSNSSGYTEWLHFFLGTSRPFIQLLRFAAIPL